MFLSSLFLVFGAVFVGVTEAASFLSVGDWGGAALGSPQSANAMAVAAAMEHGKGDAKWVLNTGDNFYWCGIQSVQDSQVTADQSDVFEGVGLPWQCALGNHAYGQNVSAQVDLTGRLTNWNLPARQYTVRPMDGIQLVVLDTSPCVSGYRGDDRTKWDPCGTEYPTCSQDAGDDDYEGTCRFHENILAANCTEQWVWFREVWNALSADDLVIVMGHHPIQEVDVEPGFVTLVGDARVDLQLNGHTHLLNRQAVGGVGKQVTTGAGSMVNVPGADEVPGEDEVFGVSHVVIWTERVAGFTRHTVNWSTRNLLTEYIGISGEVLYDFSVGF